MSPRTRALSISSEVKRSVYERDGGRCIFCGRPGNPEMHYIPRSKGGLGIEENIGTGCRECHRKLDETTQRPEMLKQFKAHLNIWYPGFPDEQRIYRR